MTDSFDPDATVPLVRPFLDRKRPMTPVSSDELPFAASQAVRAYAITGGRAHAAAPLEFETMMQTTGAGRESLTAQKFERADILRRCQSEPLSVAELSALMRIPIGVVRVVAADMVGEGLLESFQPSTNVADDVLLITRLIAGVRAL